MTDDYAITVQQEQAFSGMSSINAMEKSLLTLGYDSLYWPTIMPDGGSVKFEVEVIDFIKQ